jgi:hypothetical protein
MSKKKKKKPRKKAAPKKKETKEQKEKRLLLEKEHKKRVDEQDTDYKEKVWTSMFSKIASLIQNETELKVENDNLMPFDFVATSDQEFDAQKDVVIEKIQNLLSINKPDDSLALFREARCLWPNDRELFGAPQIQADEEFEIYKNLYMKQIEIKKPILQAEPELIEKEEQPENKDEGIEDDDLFNDENKESNEYEEEENEEEEKYVQEEENLDIEKFLFRYTHPHILKCYILMLSEYAKNSDFLNRCCMGMFEKIAYDCHSIQCLYQLSLFNLINTIYKDPMSRCIMNILGSNTQKRSIDDLYASSYSTEDMFAFFRQLIEKFFEQAKKNNKLFLEILFFKEKKTLYCLGEESTGYDPMFEPSNNGKKKRIAWTQDEQDELKDLFDKYKSKFEKKEETEDGEENNNESLDDDGQRLEGDLIDQIMLHIQDGSRKRKDICNQLVNIGCVKSIDEFKTNKWNKNGNKKLGRNGMWRPEDIDDLRQCFELVKSESKQTDSPLNQMMHKLKEIMTIKRSKKEIADKLVEINLIKDKNEILSKKSKSSKKSEMNSDDSDTEQVKEKSKKKKSKSKKSKSSDGNDLFDAESAESDSSDDEKKSSSSSSSSESDNEATVTKSSRKKTTLSELLDSEDEEPNIINSKSLDKQEEESSLDSQDAVLTKENEGDSSETTKENRENKKRKKKTKFRIIEDDSSSNSNDAQQSLLSNKKKDNALNEISNSDKNDSELNKENGKVVKINYSDLFNKIINNDENESSSDSEDDDLPLSALVSKPKRQKLVLSDDDE